MKRLGQLIIVAFLLVLAGLIAWQFRPATWRPAEWPWDNIRNWVGALSGWAAFAAAVWTVSHLKRQIKQASDHQRETMRWVTWDVRILAQTASAHARTINTMAQLARVNLDQDHQLPVMFISAIIETIEAPIFAEIDRRLPVNEADRWHNLLPTLQQLRDDLTRQGGSKTLLEGEKRRVTAAMDWALAYAAAIEAASQEALRVVVA